VSPREYIHGSKNVITIAKALLDLTLSESTRKEDLLPEISTLPKILDYTNQHPQDARGRLVFVRNLGGGGQGNVSQVECSGKYFAQKTIKFDVPDDPMTKDEASGKREAFLREEIQIMKKLRHVHITEVIFTIKDPQSFGFAMLPVADKDLGAFLRISNEKHYLGTKISRIPQWMGCLVNALAFAHKRRIRHKDIKPVNILIKGDQIFWTDFGLAVDFSDAKLSYTTNSFKGTYPYRAPESETGMKHSRAADIFSLGCVFTEMLVAYRRRDPNRVLQSRVAYCERIPEVRKLVLSLKGNEGDSLGKFLVEATLDMLEKEPGSRKTALDLQKCFEAEEGVCCNTCRVHK
jgi:serine/threonine protein kinase